MNGTINPGRTPGFYSFHLIFDYIFLQELGTTNFESFIHPAGQITVYLP